MAKKILTIPVKAEDLEDINIGDIIYVNGHIVTCRDVAHRRLIEEEFIKQTGVKVIVGKGGMGKGTEKGCQEGKAIHCVFPAGCAVVAAACVEEIEDAQWRDLGMPETLWVCRVQEFGPLIVSIDAHGRNLFEENKVIFNQKKDEAVEEICKKVSFIK